ncbi:MAG: hypothetical protein US86_C0001G0387 [Candidatus Daviesbacteria bacterium GW2011_GWA2_38_24]|uniref:Uncharacterized protein n=1 Tax=Candidatus Daviesbacteria bacterium GW2011_GWA2_38_24 TaxID=1618422 RepID=A0A0G0JWE9_9BACT|nr:MAG: hypothetical protein US86_C0001G0387 [Candidatus Daviesbacteria bacterium GW2011_GWA2_38_24]KKQ78279.1 MAG: hypothetical protein UT01_C0075G0004 [Candidatus Daviesbacteria bacterium GW2011_GWA1_38_7]
MLERKLSKYQLAQQRAGNLVKIEGYYGRRMFNKEKEGEIVDIDCLVDEHSKLNQIANNRIWLVKKFAGIRISLREALNKEENLKLRRVKSRMKYWEDLGYLEWM